MKKYIASCKDSDGNIFILKEEYETKADFKADIRANGLTITYSYIFTSEEYDKFISDDPEFMAWFIARLEKRRESNKKAVAIKKIVKAYKEVREVEQMNNTVNTNDLKLQMETYRAKAGTLGAAYMVKIISLDLNNWEQLDLVQMESCIYRTKLELKKIQEERAKETTLIHITYKEDGNIKSSLIKSNYEMEKSKKFLTIQSMEIYKAADQLEKVNELNKIINEVERNNIYYLNNVITDIKENMEKMTYSKIVEKIAQLRLEIETIEKARSCEDGQQELIVFNNGIRNIYQYIYSDYEFMKYAEIFNHVEKMEI